jgi:hypothetical protein
MFGCLQAFLERAVSLEEVIICVIDYRDYVPFSKKIESL